MSEHDRLVVFEDLKKRYGIPYCTQHLSRLEKNNKFPRRRKLSGRRNVWSAKEVQAWVDSNFSSDFDKAAKEINTLMDKATDLVNGGKK